jgi:alkylated DNA repair dioxygenase AlkB
MEAVKTLTTILKDNEGSEVTYLPSFIAKETTENYYDALMEFYGECFESNVVIMYGKTFTPKRKSVQISETGTKYNFNGAKEHNVYGFSKELKELKEMVEKECRCKFNYALINYYEDGDAYISAHSDNERDLVEGAPIASLSLGATRCFRFLHKSTNEKHSVELEDGSLLLMCGATQSYWKHELPKRANCKARLNITFRCMKK